MCTPTPLQYRGHASPFVGARSPAPSSPPSSSARGTAGLPKYVASAVEKKRERGAKRARGGGTGGVFLTSTTVRRGCERADRMSPTTSTYYSVVWPPLCTEM